MIRNWNGDGAVGYFPLHDDVTSAMSDFFIAMMLKNTAHLFTLQCTKLTQQQFPDGLYRFHYYAAVIVSLLAMPFRKITLMLL